MFLVARWTYYTDGGYSHDDLSYVGSSQTARQLDSSRATFLRGLEQTVRAYAGVGVTHLVIVKQIPQQLGDPSGIYQRSFRRAADARQPALDGASVPRDAHRRLQAFLDSAFTSLGAASLDLVDLDSLFCDTARCRIGTTQTSWYVDDDHLSFAGAYRAVPALLEALRPTTLASSRGRQVASRHQH